MTLDDATSEIYSAFFIEEEGTLSSYRGLREVLETQGLFSSLYRDRGSHYWHTDEAGGRVNKSRPTHVHRALQQLGITLIAAYSRKTPGPVGAGLPDSAGSIAEKVWPWPRLPRMAAANQYLTAHFIPAHNQRFAIPAAEAGTAFVPWVGTSLAEMLCVQEERIVAKDNTVRYQGLSLQIPHDTHRFHYVKVTVGVHAYSDGRLAVFHGPRCLARYQADGRVIEPKAESGRRKDLSPRSRARPIVAPRAIVCERFSVRG